MEGLSRPPPPKSGKFLWDSSAGTPRRGDSLSANAFTSSVYAQILTSFTRHSPRSAPPPRKTAPLTHVNTQSYPKTTPTHSLNRSPTSRKHIHSPTGMHNGSWPQHGRISHPTPYPGPHDFYQRNGSTQTAQLSRGTRDWVQRWCTSQHAPPYTSMPKDAKKPAPSCERN